MKPPAAQPTENARATGARSPQPLDKASPSATGQPPAGGQRLSTQQMMAKLKHASHRRVLPIRLKNSSAESAAPASVQTKPAEPPKYEVADCGTAASPMICCHHGAGDGSSCNLFKILCKNAGGTAAGDGESAACSDW
jgi:hypothetical protein